MTTPPQQPYGQPYEQPYGQPYGQAYGQPGTSQPGMSQPAQATGPYGAGRPGYGGYGMGTAPARSSGGLAVAAGVVSIAGGLWQITLAILQFVRLSDLSGSGLGTLFLIEAVVQVLVALVLLVGGILIFPGKAVGRWLVLGGAAGYVFTGVIFTIITYTVF